MCGIAGYISKTETADPARLIQTMTDAVAHRGPDGLGIWQRENLALGHRRLSILDLSEAGHQPMIDPAFGRVITFNGEIYNYIEIRKELLLKGYQFTSRTDTEVILKAYDMWGEECVHKFNGMWAFAIYDPKNQRLFCSRDRFGVKPFYYSDARSFFAFGSEIRQLLPLLPKVSADTNVLMTFLISRVAEADTSTFYHGVKKLPGGHNLSYNLASGEYSIKRYYSIQESSAYSGISIEQAEETFLTLFDDAIRLRLRSDVRVGTCLSGGLDSSSIATLAASKYSFGPSKNFSAITAVSEDPETDESSFAKMVVDSAGLDWITVKPNYNDFCQALGPTVKAQEEPFASASVIMQYFVMETAKQAGIPVLLDGQGGDETLLGYQRYFADYCLELIKKGRVIPCLDFLWNLGRNGPSNAFRSMINDLLYFHASDIKRFATRKQNNIFRSSLGAVLFNSSVSARSYSNFFDMQRLEIQSKNLPALLRYEDKNSMWHSIETRLPFLDYRLVEFALSIPTSMKLNKGWAKFLLRKSMASKLPDEIVWRRNKLGFEAPESKWMQQHSHSFKSEIKDSALLAEICKKDVLTGGQGTQLHAGMRWRLYSTALWAKEFGVTDLS